MRARAWCQPGALPLILPREELASSLGPSAPPTGVPRVHLLQGMPSRRFNEVLGYMGPEEIMGRG